MFISSLSLSLSVNKEAFQCTHKTVFNALHSVMGMTYKQSLLTIKHEHKEGDLYLYTWEVNLNSNY